MSCIDRVEWCGGGGGTVMEEVLVMWVKRCAGVGDSTRYDTVCNDYRPNNVVVVLKVVRYTLCIGGGTVWSLWWV